MNYYRWNVYVNLLIELKGKKNDHSIFQPPWTDNNPLARMTHISAQWSYFPRFEAKSEISLSLGGRGGGGASLEPVALNPMVESASGSAVAWIEAATVRWKGRKEKGASRCAHAGPKKKTVFGRVRRKWNGLRENERAPALCVYGRHWTSDLHTRTGLCSRPLFASHRPDLPSPR